MSKSPKASILLVYTEPVRRNTAGFPEPRTIAARLGMHDFEIPAHAAAIAWPIAGRFVEADGSAKAKAHNSRVARTTNDAVASVVDRVVAHLASGGELRLWIREGCILSRNPDDRIYETVAAPAQLADVARHASIVKVHSTSQDPRHFWAEDDAEEGDAIL